MKYIEYDPKVQFELEWRRLPHLQGMLIKARLATGFMFKTLFLRDEIYRYSNTAKFVNALKRNIEYDSIL